jgi:hypothetical protein
MAALASNSRNCLFCKKQPWDAEELDLLKWYSVNMNGRLDTRICNFHSKRQVERLPNVRARIQEASKRHATAVPDPMEAHEARQRIYMDHYREMQSDREKASGCCAVM